MSNQIVIDDAKLAATQSHLHDISSDDCQRSVNCMSEAARGQNDAQWGIESASVAYRQELESALSYSQDQIESLLQRIRTLAERVNEARRNAQATDSEIAEIFTTHQNTVENSLQPHSPPAPRPATETDMVWN